ncbi:polyprenyl synthetase family protein [Desulfovibrio sp. JC010]|uniref:polyprenyl synthetase family protein n=1 Tax=Desulfovibrio sp. JC010 TaxID=2593641 RepID=UPI0013D7E945|nr:polyprenyl synthetase family protein [Desulfovibrio sp. JC010]NDV26890.1 hypothetical protein [Desulfovibrio sp. JC010]
MIIPHNILKHAEKLLNFENETVHMLTLLYGMAVKDEDDNFHLEVAKTIELLKTSALTMDDFLDKSSMRNGVESFFSAYGSETTVLFSEILKSTASLKFNDLVYEFSPHNLKKANAIFEETYRAICLGQLLDIELEKRVLSYDSPTLDECLKVVEFSTASFIQMPLVLGGILSDKDHDTISGFSDFGYNIGMAYQLRDDVIDFVGDTARIGKPKYGDLIRKKKKAILAILKNSLSDSELNGLCAIYNSPEEVSKEDLDYMLGLISKYSAVDRVKDLVKEYCAKALDSLDRDKFSVNEISDFRELSSMVSSF